MDERLEQHGNGRTVDQRSGAQPHPVFWVIAVALVALVIAEVVKRPSGMLDTAALAQPVSSGGSRGVFAFSGQLTKNTFGVYMVDVDAMTIWTYEYQPDKRCMGLAAARTWRYDRYLENHNGCDLPPDMVEQMVEDQRQYRLQAQENKLP